MKGDRADETRVKKGFDRTQDTEVQATSCAVQVAAGRNSDVSTRVAGCG